MSTITGQCLCGSIHYEAKQLVSNMSNCHCNMCRKFHGAAYATFAQAKREDFNWTSGVDLIQTYEADNGTVRLFCSQCGSSLMFQDDNKNDSELVHFAAGTIDTAINETPDRHIYLESKANWLSINDDITKYGKGSGS